MIRQKFHAVSATERQRMHTVFVWAEFALLAAAIALAGARLSADGDVIARHSAAGSAWIGVVLLATVTSLPELITGVGSVAIAGLPDIAVGDALGSCVFNLVIIVFVDFLSRGESVYTRARRGHALAGGMGVILIGFTALNILLGSRIEGIAIFGIGYYTPVIILLYLVGIRAVYHYEIADGDHDRGTIARDKSDQLALAASVRRFALLSVVVVLAGTRLPFAAENVAVRMSWNMTFVGSTFVALTTSLPELVVTLAAVRRGSVDMAAGNIFGSNLFNILILAIDDIFYRPGPLLSHVSSAHAFSALTAMTMTGVAIVGLFYRPRTRTWGAVGWSGLFVVLLYLFNLMVLYLYSA
jgi:cation:H+ antiporter